MQSSCIGSLMELADQDQNILYLTADSGEGGLDFMFRKNFPDRSFNFGIAEENMVAASAGLAASGKIPFVYTAAPFLAYRSYEFIRNDICLQNLPVKLIGTGSGLSVSSLGPTHHTTEDISVLRSLPNLKILSPATPKQAYECMKVAYRYSGPVYIRLGMNKEKEYFPDDYQFPIDKNEVLKDGEDVTIFTTGAILEEAMNAAELLEAEGTSVCVVNVPTIKPFDKENVIELAGKTKLFFVVEEHNILGGLGSIISDVLVDAGCLKKTVKVGLKDCFSVGYGTLPQIRKENGLDVETITSRIKEALG
ncbi:MAG: transketolase [Acetatifactor sp.]|nr:transketolase [Acetatifactor sp.]